MSSDNLPLWIEGTIVSPDGLFVYACGTASDPDDGALTVYARDPTDGDLTFVDRITQGAGGIDGQMLVFRR